MSNALIVAASNPRHKKAHAFPGIVHWTSGLEADVITSPIESWGAGAPTHTSTLNSIYWRTDATGTSDLIYRNTDGATTWEAMALTGTSSNNTWTGTNDFSKTVTATDELINADLTVNSATAVGVGVDATVTQATTARTAGSVSAFRAKTTSLAGDLNSVEYIDYRAVAPTDGGGTVVHTALKIEAGHDLAIDSSAAATGETLWRVGDNLASAWEIKQGSNSYLKCTTTDGSEAVEIGKPLLLSGGIAPGGRFISTEQTGTGAPQNVAHGLGTTPSMVWWSLSDCPAGAFTLAPGAHDATNAKFTVTSGVKFYVFALK